MSHGDGGSQTGLVVCERLTLPLGTQTVVQDSELLLAFVSVLVPPVIVAGVLVPNSLPSLSSLSS